MIFTENDGLAAWQRVPAAELNLVFSPWCGIEAAAKLEQKLALRTWNSQVFLLARKIRLASCGLSPSNSVFQRPSGSGHCSSRISNLSLHRVCGRYGDDALPHAFAAVVADTSTAIGLTRYISNELGWLPEVVVVTDDPPPAARDRIVQYLRDGLDSAVKPEVIFEVDSHKIRLLLRQHTHKSYLRAHSRNISRATSSTQCRSA